jgi:hypothetical protein
MLKKVKIHKILWHFSLEGGGGGVCVVLVHVLPVLPFTFLNKYLQLFQQADLLLGFLNRDFNLTGRPAWFLELGC